MSSASERPRFGVQNAIAQAELDGLDRDSEFVTVNFNLENGTLLPISTTRPELLPACVVFFVHPQNERFRELVGQEVRMPLFDRQVVSMAVPLADPEKGTHVVMCCIFRDVTDVTWCWQ